MMRRLSYFMVAIAAASTSIIPGNAAQDVSMAVAAGAGQGRTENLAFSKDGQALREVKSVASETDRFWHVSAITYVAATGVKSHEWNLQPYSRYYSATTDGRIAIISVDTGRPEERVHPFLLDTDTGLTENIPSNWFDADDQNPFAKISGDGRFVSAYSELGPDESPMVVSVYEWRTKKLFARQMSNFISAGGIVAGGVTEDGKIAFYNNRVGSEIVDPKTGRLVVKASPNSHRSLDGAWVVEFPNPIYDDAARKVLVKNGRNGEVVGKLDLQIKDDKEMESWSWARAAFCGTSGRFIAATHDTVQAFEIPSGKKIADFPAGTWKDAKAIETDPTVTIACSLNGRRVAIRSGARLTLHDLK